LRNLVGEFENPPSVVLSTRPVAYRADTFCATEPKAGRLCFNGYITGNCTEITLPTGIDHNDKMRTAVCCLSSVNGEKFDEWQDHPQFLEDLFRMLDNALQSFIDKAPPSLANAVYSASQERSVGLGLLGFQAYLQKNNVSLESDGARTINKLMFNHLRKEADRISLKLGLERGEAPDMVGTGERFAHKLAIAPNASSSILCGGTSPSIEPHRANAYLHKTLSGSFPVKNQFLIAALKKLGLDTDETWRSIIATEGSVQHLDIPKEVKDVFKTATELDQMVLVDLAADRARFICQAQSLNLFFEAGTEAGVLTKTHYAAWEKGVKSLYYCRSTTAKRAENTNDKVARMDMSQPVEDAACVACEG
jgi:ribonucleotide reductase alpha subunit